MYSLVIAEDELMTRRGLVRMVKWNELGFQVDAEFSDGQELLEYLKTNMPDVILTDIKMSKVSGLEIAKFVAEQNLPVQVVFLSGYKDFEYAQSAVEYRVLHYLVKPISVPKLKEIFTGIREKLDQQNELQNAMLNRVDHYQKLVNYQKQQFVLEAWNGQIEDIQEAEKKLSMLEQEERKPVLLIRLLLKNDSAYAGFLADYGFQEMQDQMTDILRNLDVDMEYYPIKWEKMQSGKILSGLGVFWGRKSQMTPVWKMKETLQRKCFELMKVQVEFVIVKEMKSALELMNTSQEDNFQIESAKENGSGIENVMAYLQEHFCEDITLTDIAENVFLNPIYISRLIKEQTGKNYTELLAELRIGKAISLLKHTDLYVYEIAESVGYHNLKYFYKVFKKVTGASANDYRSGKKKKEEESK